jgi:hypothetical protein
MQSISLKEYAEDLKMSKPAAYKRVFKAKKHPGIIHAEKIGSTYILYKSSNYDEEIKKFNKSR